VFLFQAIEDFIRSRQVNGCSRNTLIAYDSNLKRFAASAPAELDACTYPVVTEYLARLQQTLKPGSVHKDYSVLRTFFRWCANVEYIQKDPMAGLKMKTPQSLPRVPDAESVKRLLNACITPRDKALVALLIDSALRISEATALRVGDINLVDGVITIRCGKGSKDGTGFFGAEASRHLRKWMNSRTGLHLDDLLFCTDAGNRLTRQTAARILMRASKRAGLEKIVYPHALRHFAASSILRQSKNIELVRQVLRHESLAMSLRYARLTGMDLNTQFRRASPLSNL
jgi:integrase/recombinase XerD